MLSSVDVVDSCTCVKAVKVKQDRPIDTSLLSVNVSQLREVYSIFKISVLLVIQENTVFTCRIYKNTFVYIYTEESG